MPGALCVVVAADEEPRLATDGDPAQLSLRVREDEPAVDEDAHQRVLLADGVAEGRAPTPMRLPLLLPRPVASPSSRRSLCQRARGSTAGSLQNRQVLGAQAGQRVLALGDGRAAAQQASGAGHEDAEGAARRNASVTSAAVIREQLAARGLGPEAGAASRDRAPLQLALPFGCAASSSAG